MMACLLDARTQAVIVGTLRTLLHTDDQQLQGWLRGQKMTNWAEVSYRDKKEAILDSDKGDCGETWRN